MSDPIEIALIVAGIFERLGVPYAIGGSLASSFHGESRSTQNVDFIADLQPANLLAFYAAVAEAFYADAEAIRQAVAERRSFNLIHLEAMFKVDVFVTGPTCLGREAMQRRRRGVLRVVIERTAFVAAADYMVIQKLDWYRRGGSVWDLQWRDVLGILKTQGSRLNLDGLRRMTAAAGVSDLLDRAVRESGLAP